MDKTNALESTHPSTEVVCVVLRFVPEHGCGLQQAIVGAVAAAVVGVDSIQRSLQQAERHPL